MKNEYRIRVFTVYMKSKNVYLFTSREVLHSKLPFTMEKCIVDENMLPVRKQIMFFSTNSLKKNEIFEFFYSLF